MFDIEISYPIYPFKEWLLITFVSRIVVSCKLNNTGNRWYIFYIYILISNSMEILNNILHIIVSMWITDIQYHQKISASFIKRLLIWNRCVQSNVTVLWNE